jgi:hypothetical protein
MKESGVKILPQKPGVGKTWGLISGCNNKHIRKCIPPSITVECKVIKEANAFLL